MELTILGAHNQESSSTRLSCLLIDETLALDAGALTSSLSLEAQQKLKALLLTHRHYDHVRDVPALAINIYGLGSLNLYAPPDVLEAVSAHLLNGVLYPRFQERLSFGEPSVRFHPLELLKAATIEGYQVLAVPVPHPVPTVGYQVSQGGKNLFYTSDTGPGLASCWEHVSPSLLITEVTLSNAFEGMAVQSGHLTPSLLKRELVEFLRLKGYLPPVIVLHMSPRLEDAIRAEVAALSRELSATITVGQAGMRVSL